VRERGTGIRGPPANPAKTWLGSIKRQSMDVQGTGVVHGIRFWTSFSSVPESCHVRMLVRRPA
jgi:hypothetical protein